MVPSKIGYPERRMKMKKDNKAVCVHGECLNHKPNFEETIETKLKAYYGIFGVKICFLRGLCCGKLLLHGRKIFVKKCKTCERIQEIESSSEIAFCSCCGLIQYLESGGGGIFQ
jgi:hypothetical protein